MEMNYVIIWKIVNEEGSWQGELVDEKKDGTPYPKYMTISKIFDSKSDTLSNYLQVVEDLTNTKITKVIAEGVETDAQYLFRKNTTAMPSRAIISTSHCQQRNLKG